MADEMEIDKVQGPAEDKPKKKDTISKDDKEFEELMKTQKISETELEGKKKKKLKKSDLEEKQTFITDDTKTTLPSLHDTYHVGKSKTEFQKQNKDSDQTQIPSDKNIQFRKSSEDTQKEKIQIPEVKDRYVETDEEKDIEKAKDILIDKAHKIEEELLAKEKEDEFQSLVLQEMPKEIASQVETLTGVIPSYLHADIVPLFEKMVGTIIVFQAQQITQTEITLTSPAFENSIFFGSVIVLQRYSTAPDSFNIILKGPTQAANVFASNIESLYNAFKSGNFDFTINRIDVEYEQPLFKRKKSKEHEEE